MPCSSEEECRRCVILGGCPPAGAAVSGPGHAATDAMTPASALAGLLENGGLKADAAQLLTACAYVLGVLGLPMMPRSASGSAKPPHRHSPADAVGGNL